MKKQSPAIESTRQKAPVILYVLLLALGFITGIVLMLFLPENEKAQPQQAIEPVATNIFINPLTAFPEYKKFDLNEITTIEPKIKALAEDALSNKESTLLAVYFRDLTNDHHFGIQEEVLFSPSSLFKVPVMIAVLKLADQDAKILSRRILFKDNSREEYQYMRKDDSRTVLIPNLEYTVDQLLEISICESDNEANFLLIDFLDRESPGLFERVQAHLGVSIPDDAGYEGDFASVKSYSSFFRTLYNASYLSEKMSQKALGILSRSTFGLGIRQAVPNNILVSHKFGYKELGNILQLHHFGIIYHPRKPFLLGIMTKGDDFDELRELIAAITKTIYREIDEQTKSSTYLGRDIN